MFSGNQSKKLGMGSLCLVRFLNCRLFGSLAPSFSQCAAPGLFVSSSWTQSNDTVSSCVLIGSLMLCGTAIPFTLEVEDLM